jgi:predicted metal-dependent hydrolase
MAQQLGLFDGGPASVGTALPHVSTSTRAPLRVRESRRARRLTLRLLPPHTLELVVPRGTRPADVAAFVREHKRWIERARGEIAARYPPAHDGLPQRVELAAIAQGWAVRYERAPGARQSCRTAGEALIVRTRDPEHRNAGDLLRAWLIGQARLHLRPRLFDEGRRLGLRPKSVQVRLQRTRWGSCSSSGGISLNAGLMFLAPPLVRYLMIHELCHMIALNHSRRFWRAVERVEPGYRELDRQLGEAWALIPLWAHDRTERGSKTFELE